MSIIDRCVRMIERQNQPNYQAGTRFTNRSHVPIIGPAWSYSPRLSLRAEDGKWVREGRKWWFISDPTSYLHLHVYGYRVMTMDPKARTIQVHGPGCARTLRNAAYSARLPLPINYHYDTHHDAGGWAMRCANGTFPLCGSTFREEGSRLVCPDEHTRFRKSVVSAESTAYVRAMGRRLRAAYRGLDVLRRNGSRDSGAYNIPFMAPYFEMGPAEVTRMIKDWTDSGDIHPDGNVYACLLTFGGVWGYRWSAWQASSAEQYFQRCVSRAVRELRRLKFFEYV